MPEGLENTVPAATAPIPLRESIEAQVEEIRGWILGCVKDGRQVVGMMSMMTELYEEAKIRRERREALGRAVASGGILAVVVATVTYLKDHLK